MAGMPSAANERQAPRAVNGARIFSGIDDTRLPPLVGPALYWHAAGSSTTPCFAPLCAGVDAARKTQNPKKAPHG